MHLDVNVQPYCQLRGIFVCIHRDASRRLARTMQARRFWSSDVNPHQQRTPRQHAFRRFRRMTGDAQAQRLVDAAIGVRQLDVKYVTCIASSQATGTHRSNGTRESTLFGL